MNPFDQQLRAAKKKQRLLFDQKLRAAKKKQRLYSFGVFALLLIGTLIILTVILASRGTRVEIKPDDATAQSFVRLHTGIAVIIGETLYSMSKNPIIIVSADGFQSKTHCR
jgi:hypothetical protein